MAQGRGSITPRALPAELDARPVARLELGDGARIPRWTSGRECWVFRAETAEELCGYHAQLIASALAPHERLEHLLYSPRSDATDGPFRVGGAPGSHAVGITQGRLLISHDPHADSPPRSVLRIDLSVVSALELGSALTLGWFVVRFGGPQGAASCAVTFSSSGIAHFRELVRVYRHLGRRARAPRRGAFEWPSVWEVVPAYLRSELEPLTDAGEPPLAVLRSPERWTSEKGFWSTRAVCVCAAGLLVATPLGLLWAASEPSLRPGGYGFGVNVTVVPPDRVLEAAIGTRGTLGVLRLRVGSGAAPHELEVPFDPDDVRSAETVVQLVRCWRGAA